MNETLKDLIEQTEKRIVDSARQPVIDKLEKALEINREMREVLEHAVSWGHGFESVGPRPEWLTEAEEVLAKGDRQ